ATQRRGRRRDDVAAAHLGVADAGQHITDRISKGHSVLSLPARLDHAGHLPEIAEFAQRDPAHPQLAVEATRAAGHFATVADATGRGVARQLGQLQLGGETLFYRHALVLRQQLQLGATAGILLGELLATVVLLD